MLATVARILADRAEDAALTLNGDALMLTRVAGTIQRHNTDGWYGEDYDRILQLQSARALNNPRQGAEPILKSAPDPSSNGLLHLRSAALDLFGTHRRRVG